MFSVSVPLIAIPLLVYAVTTVCFDLACASVYICYHLLVLNCSFVLLPPPRLGLAQRLSVCLRSPSAFLMGFSETCKRH